VLDDAANLFERGRDPTDSGERNLLTARVKPTSAPKIRRPAAPENGEGPCEVQGPRGAIA
jgi:hypothetical protein